jgi:branched-chain amino acid transport system substrate-binding protein
MFFLGWHPSHRYRDLVAVRDRVQPMGDARGTTTAPARTPAGGGACSPNMFGVKARAFQQSAALAQWLAQDKPKARLFLLGPDYEMGRSTVAAFKIAAEQKGAEPVGEMFAPLDSKDYSQYFGQIRAARPSSTPPSPATTPCGCSRRCRNTG